MIRVIFGWYSPSNPLFGFNSGSIINATDIKSNEIDSFVDNLISLVHTNNGEIYNFYVGKNKTLVKRLAKKVRSEHLTFEDILLVYDNGWKFWGISWSAKTINQYLIAMDEDIKIGLI